MNRSPWNDPSAPAGRRDLRLYLIFLSLYLVLAGLAVVFPYEYRDSDSSAYHSISAKLAARPPAEWIHPEWWGHGGNGGLFRDHPPGIFWLPAVFVRLGVPGRAAPLCANFLYMLLLLLALHGLVKKFLGLTAAWGAVFAFVLTPIFVQYLMRANHELPLALAVTAGLFGLARCGESPRWSALYAASLLLAVFIKGVSGLALTLASAALWLAVGRPRRILQAVAAGHVLALASVLGFEALYRSATGESFLNFYLGFQGGKAVEAGFRPVMKLYNFGWYLGRILWFAAPWVLFLAYGALKSIRDRSGLLRSPFLRLALSASGLIVIFFSLFDRKADRYIFPAYVLLSAAGAAVLDARKPRWKRMFEKTPVRLALAIGALLVLMTLLRIYFHTYHYRFIRLWAQ
jgi:4-amino-4-deoxy-L-arabinose transferase-like glycosyltransferase